MQTLIASVRSGPVESVGRNFVQHCVCAADLVVARRCSVDVRIRCLYGGIGIVARAFDCRVDLFLHFGIDLLLAREVARNAYEHTHIELKYLELKVFV